MKEKQIETAILQYLSLRSDCFVWKNNTVGIYDPIKKVFRKPKSKYNINGVSDILGIAKGCPIAIEVKTSKGKLSEYQKEFLENFEKSGGKVLVARCLDDVISFISCLKSKS